MLPPVWNYPFTYREVKGSQLTNTEVDNNFKAVAERAEYAQTVAETLPDEIALEAASAANSAASSIASSALAGVTAEANRAKAEADNAAAVVTGGTATLTPQAGKIPLANASAKIDSGWLDAVGTGKVMREGAGGWMGRGGVSATALSYPASVDDPTNLTKTIRSEVNDNGILSSSSGIHFACSNTWGRVRISHFTTQAWLQGGLTNNGSGWTAELYHTGNTTKNPDGTLHASSPVINLYTDKIELHNESQFGAIPQFTRLSKGVYEITGTLGLRSEGWYLDTPSDRNGNKYFNVEWTQNVTPEALDGVVETCRDDVVVTVETFERVWNPATGLHENGAHVDINDMQDRFVQLRFNEIKVEYEELSDETITR